MKAGLWGSLCDLAAEDAWVPAALPVQPPTRQLLPRAGPEPAVFPWPRFVLLCAAEHVCRGRVEHDARPARPGGGRGAAWAAGTGQAGSHCTRPPPGADWLTSRPCGSCAGACELPPAPLASRLAVPGSTRPRVCVRPAPLDSPLIADPCPRRTPSLPGRPFKVPRAICFLFIEGHGGGEKRPLQVLSSASIDPQAGLVLSPR